MEPRAVDVDFVRSLPKVELHAHLSGSISPQTLHDIWATKPDKNGLPDPLTAIQPGEDFVDVVSFFTLFDTYIYNLLVDEASISHATAQVIRSFADDGVAHLELRTTPRAIPSASISRADYVSVVNHAIATHTDKDRIDVKLILSIDRKMSPTEALEIVQLAETYRYHEPIPSFPTSHQARNPDTCVAPVKAEEYEEEQAGTVVGIDLCGNPARGTVSTFTPAFHLAKSLGLKVTLHFAEIPASASEEELDTILSWQPDRLGHVIHVPERQKRVVEERGIGVELCLSCNVLGKLTNGGYERHHFGEWWRTKCPVALSTDDVGVFGSALSNEYLLAAKHFNLDRKDLIGLSKSAARAVFSGQHRLQQRILAFESELASIENHDRSTRS